MQAQQSKAKVKSPSIITIDFSKLDKGQYPYRYSLKYVLEKFFSYEGYNNELLELQKLLGIREKMLKNYMSVKRSDKGKFVMSNDKKKKIAERWGLETFDQLVT